MADRRKVLITGAAGRIGSFLTGLFADRYELVLADITPTADTRHPFHMVDITDLHALRRACQGVDTVVHLAANPNEDAPWESVLPNNIVGVYNVFEAAQQAGCRRVIFSSSVHAVFGYPSDVQVHTPMPVRPLNLYGASKAWGEVVACLYADQRNLSAICLRFGWVVERDSPALHFGHPYLDIAFTYDDLGRLVISCIEAPDSVRYGVFHGVSNNRHKRLDISDARAILGYDPPGR